MARGTIDIDINRCKGCGVCLTVCKSKVIKLADRGQTNKFGYSYLVTDKPDNCTGCALCAVMCPDCAITVSRESR